MTSVCEQHELGDSDPASDPLGDLWVPVRKARFEVRWFTDGDLPRRSRPRRPSVRRVDEYHVDSLSADLSIKRRGDTQRLERKTRSQAVPVRVGDVEGIAECWQKWLAPECDGELLDGPWLPVKKQIWTLSGIEVARVGIGSRWWWSLAYAVGAPDRPYDERTDAWLELFDDSSRPGSYAEWVRTALDETSPG